MSALEILTIGDELIEGRLIDTNAAWISEQLIAMGFEVTRHTTVGDNIDVLVEALKVAASRNDAVIVTGGLGPTTDDLTAESAAEAFAAPLEERPEAKEHLESYFASKGRPISPNNYNQALLPKGSTLIPNPKGTAVGFRVNTDRSRIYFMPGVPREMKAMFADWVASDLTSALEPHPARIISMKLYGVGESNVGQSLSGLEALVPSGGRLGVQYRASFPEIHVRLLLHGLEGERGDEVIAALKDEAATRVGRYIFATGGAKLETSFPEVVLEEARNKGLTLCTAESCTGGMIGSMLTSVPGSSDVFLGGIISYANSVKVRQLGVEQGILDSHGAVSQECVESMAQGARASLGADFAMAVSGIAGPGGGSADKPVGTVWIAIAGPDSLNSRRFHMPLDRERMRQLSAYTSMSLLRKAMRAHKPSASPTS